MKLLKFSLLSAFCMLCILPACTTIDRSTHVHGKVTDTANHPIADVPILIAGTKKGILIRLEDIQTIYTDKTGNYSLSLVPSSQYTELQVINQFWLNPNLDQYKGGDIFLNGENTDYCCQAPIGKETRYDFTLIPK